MAPFDATTPQYVVIERDKKPHLAVTYSNRKVADHALTHSPLIDSLCEENALDCYASAVIPDGAEVIVADASDIATMLENELP